MSAWRSSSPALINLCARPGRRAAQKLFADWAQLRQVLSVVIPTAVYVALVPWLGLYVASLLLIAVFMKWLGRYSWALYARGRDRRAACSPS